MKSNKEYKIAGANLDERLEAIARWLEDQKALEPYKLKIAKPNVLAEAVIIASATSRRHAQGLAKGLLQILAEAGEDFLHLEGFEVAQWILLDCNDILVHIFLPETRELYRLEELYDQANNSQKEPRE